MPMSCDMKTAVSEFPPPETAESSIAVRVDHLSKSYSMWSSPKARLMRPVLNLAQRVLPFSQSHIERLQKRIATMHKDFYALRDVSFEIRKGESWGFVGVNGSGKSTLLKIISGNLLPTTGSVEVDGKVAILDYGAGFSGEFTGRENVYLKASMLGLTRADVDRRFSSIEAFAEIGEFIDQPVKTYSSGMQARLGFAVMAHVDADIMITDEALAVGDAFFVQKCMDHIRSFLKKGTFLFVSHSVSDVVGLCEKAVWLDHGEIRAIGSAREVTDAYISSASIKASRTFLESAGALASGPSGVGSDAHNVVPEPYPVRGPGVELTGVRLSELAHAHTPRVVKDSRLELLNRTQWRNDIQIPEFSPDSKGFGLGGAHIERVAFEDDTGAAISWVIGGEMVRLVVELRAERDLESPIVGFQVRDRLGQSLFADNTYLVTLDNPFVVRAGQRFQAEFSFQMPLLPVGEYVIRPAVAEGTESENAMLHCIDNGLSFRSITSGARHGLVGVPMQKIRLYLSE